MKNEYNLFFYKKLFESTPIFNQNSFTPKKNHFSFFSYVYKKILNILISLYSILKCFFLKKEKILFFNHTKRTIYNNHQHKTPLYLNKRVFSPDYFYYIDNDLNKIASYKGPKSILDIAKINELISTIIIPLRLINKFKKHPLTFKEIYFYTYVRFWIIILKILKPRKIMLVVWYGYQPIIVAAKIVGVQTIDLQHGLIYNDHQFYNLNDKSLNTLEKYTLPDQCWVYGNYWKNQLLKAGWCQSKVKVLGYYLNVPKKEDSINFEPYILYTTSCTENKKEVLAHINSIINEVKIRGLKIIISPHPHENPQNYEDILSEIISLSDKDSYHLLKNCQVHISSFSTLLWEGLYFNKCTYILSYEKYRNHFSILSDLINKNLARYISLGQFPEIFNLEQTLNIQEFFENKINLSLVNS